MTRALTQQHYQRRFQVLVDYIFANLDGRLDLERLSEPPKDLLTDIHLPLKPINQAI